MNGSACSLWNFRCLLWYFKMFSKRNTMKFLRELHCVCVFNELSLLTVTFIYFCHVTCYLFTSPWRICTTYVLYLKHFLGFYIHSWTLTLTMFLKRVDYFIFCYNIYFNLFCSKSCQYYSICKIFLHGVPKQFYPMCQFKTCDLYSWFWYIDSKQCFSPNINRTIE